MQAFTIIAASASSLITTSTRVSEVSRGKESAFGRLAPSGPRPDDTKIPNRPPPCLGASNEDDLTKRAVNRGIEEAHPDRTPAAVQELCGTWDPELAEYQYEFEYLPISISGNFGARRGVEGPEWIT
ncbi:hypothetical protein EV368DRAFT_69590 [Lentinula lateritia]|nr:hypothetical protein EV368DRAFT_69590 [Lentinula lateritia]